MQSRAKTVAAYLKEQTPAHRAALGNLRRRIRRAAPAAAESMHHGMPSYKLHGKLLFALAVQKRYLALYVCETGALTAHRRDLGKLNCGKGCIRFSTLASLPLAAIDAILAYAVALRTQ